MLLTIHKVGCISPSAVSQPRPVELHFLTQKLDYPDIPRLVIGHTVSIIHIKMMKIETREGFQSLFEA